MQKITEPNKPSAPGAQTRKPMQPGMLDLLLNLGVQAGNQVECNEPKLKVPEKLRR